MDATDTQSGGNYAAAPHAKLDETQRLQKALHDENQIAAGWKEVLQGLRRASEDANGNAIETEHPDQWHAIIDYVGEQRAAAKRNVSRIEDMLALREAHKHNNKIARGLRPTHTSEDTILSVASSPPDADEPYPDPLNVPSWME